VNQRSFCFVFFNLVDFSNSNFILNLVERKKLKDRFTKRTSNHYNKFRNNNLADLKSKSIQNILNGLSKKGLIFDTKNKILPSYHTEYKITIFSKDIELSFRVSDLLEETRKIRAILYEKSLYWDETKHIEKATVEKIISDVLNHRICKVNNNSARWIKGTNFTMEMSFSDDCCLNVQSIRDISRTILQKPNTSKSENSSLEVKKLITFTNLRLASEQKAILEKNY
jgi:hypothetical protein